MNWVLLLGAAWVVLAVVAAVLAGRAIHLADLMTAAELQEPNFVVDSAGDEPQETAPSVVTRQEQPLATVTVEIPPTIPGIPAARPSVPLPPVPPSVKRPRQSEHG
jgi:hypothetical protein